MAKTPAPRSTKTRTRRAPARTAPAIDRAILVVLIAAMDANRHVSAREAERAHHIIWSMRRFRARSEQRVGRLIESARDRIDAEGMPDALARAARTIPVRLRSSIFAVAIDLLLADTGLDRAERRFVTQLAGLLGIDDTTAAAIRDAVLVKNRA